MTLTYGYHLRALFVWGEPREDGAKCRAWAEAAQRAVPMTYDAYTCMAIACYRNRQYDEAIRHGERALELNPNSVSVLSALSFFNASVGNVEEAQRYGAEALRLSPKDLINGNTFLALAMAAFVDEDASAFREAAERAIQFHPNAPIRRALMVAYAGQTGDHALRDTHLAVLNESAPDFIASLFSGENQPFAKPEHMKLLLDGLRKADRSE